MCLVNRVLRAHGDKSQSTDDITRPRDERHEPDGALAAVLALMEGQSRVAPMLALLEVSGDIRGVWKRSPNRYPSAEQPSRRSAYIPECLYASERYPCRADRRFGNRRRLPNAASVACTRLQREATVDPYAQVMQQRIRRLFSECMTLGEIMGRVEIRAGVPAFAAARFQVVDEGIDVERRDIGIVSNVEVRVEQTGFCDQLVLVKQDCQNLSFLASMRMYTRGLRDDEGARAK